MPLAKDRDTPYRSGELFDLPVKGATLIYGGAVVVLAAGLAEGGLTALSLKVAGVAEDRADNSAGADSDITVKVRRGVFRLANSASGDLIALSDVGSICYLVDDETVAKTSGGSTRSRAGLIVDVDAQGVWVLVGFGLLDAPGGALLAANNLSDVAAAATARANIGANKAYLHIRVADFIGAHANVYRIVAPVAGTIAKIRSVTDAALATGDATLTGKIGAAAITNGVITITQAGSAAGDVDLATPTAADVVAAGDVISITVGGANTGAGGADVSIEITV